MQTRRCFEIIADALGRAGAGLDDVVRTRLLMVDVEDVEQAAAVRKEFVGHVMPVDTIVQVGRFVNPDWLIEVEVDAVAAQDGTS
jgi:enamine deaminase RidA (YjgF/YER057c/UK114 family)